MSFFVAELQDCQVINDFFEDVLSRKEQTMVTADVHLIKKDKKVFWAQVTSINIPPIYYLSILFLLLWVAFHGWLLLGFAGFFALTGICWLRIFHVWAFKKGLRKKGYTGTINILSMDAGVKEVLF